MAPRVRLDELDVLQWSQRVKSGELSHSPTRAYATFVEWFEVEAGSVITDLEVGPTLHQDESAYTGRGPDSESLRPALERFPPPIRGRQPRLGRRQRRLGLNDGVATLLIERRV